MSSVKPALRLGQTQQLTLTPQLRQSIRMLGLSTAELEIELAEAAESNPLLEYLAPGDAPGEVGDRDASNDSDSDSPSSRDDLEFDSGPRSDDPEHARISSEAGTDLDPAEGRAEPGLEFNLDRDSDSDGVDPLSADASGVDLDFGARDAVDERFAEGEDGNERYADGDWRDSATGAAVRAGSSDLSWEERLVADAGLAAHVHAQVELLTMSPRDRLIASVIIDALDEDGMLRVGDAEVIEACGFDAVLECDEIDGVRHRLQRLDPTGIASRSMLECLDVQLSELIDASPQEIELARRLLREAAGAIGRVPLDRLARQLHCDGAALEAALARVRTLDPKPGLQFGSARTDYVQPDVIAFRHQGRWQVRLNGAAHPGLALNPHYTRMAQTANGATERYLRGRLQEARWLIRSVAARGDTLLRVAGWVVRQQSAFLDFGAQAMRPLTLREVGGALELHESTVSRATARKYVATPRGVFELRHFFSAALETETGGTASALAVQSLIRKLIEAESPRHPRSDAALAKLLAAEGIAVARRTVAKYREGMRIPSSSERCRHP